MNKVIFKLGTGSLEKKGKSNFLKKIFFENRDAMNNFK
jgi:hypothetical protein